MTSVGLDCTPGFAGKKHNSEEPKGLVDYSPKDKPWDVHRAQAEAVRAIYETCSKYEKYAERMKECSSVLRFALAPSEETGELSMRLRTAHFCRVRNCPVCQWRRTLMWAARFYEAIPKILGEHPKARWIFLTLTVRNCRIEELRSTLQSMNKAWGRLTKRKSFAGVLGWIRTSEVTRGKDGSAHPHFHCLMMVPPSYFSGKSYITKAQWAELWKKCAKLDYDPIVDVRAVKEKNVEGCVADLGILSELRKAVAETLKYAVKPSDMISDPSWFLEMTKQVFKLRFVASGGVLKNVLKEDEEESEDDLLLCKDGDGEAIKEFLMAFEWTAPRSRYVRAEKYDMTVEPKH